MLSPRWKKSRVGSPFTDPLRASVIPRRLNSRSEERRSPPQSCCIEPGENEPVAAAQLKPFPCRTSSSVRIDTAAPFVESSSRYGDAKSRRTGLAPAEVKTASPLRHCCVLSRFIIGHAGHCCTLPSHGATIIDASRLSAIRPYPAPGHNRSEHAPYLCGLPTNAVNLGCFVGLTTRCVTPSLA